MFNKFKYYVFPENPLDGRITSRLKRGVIHWAQAPKRSGMEPLRRWIRDQHFQFQFESPAGQRRLSVSGGDITHLWVADEVLIERVYRLADVPFTPDLVFDLGANIGLFTLVAAQRWPGAAFVCVEPHPTTFSFLCENLALNGINAMKLQCALDAEVGVRFMETEPDWPGAVFQTLSSRVSATRVTTLKLDSLLPAQRDLKLLIKMDIEGSEVSVLNHLTASLPEETFVFIELHNGDESLRWIGDWAERNGFAFHEVRRREKAIDGYLFRTRGARQEIAPVLESVTFTTAPVLTTAPEFNPVP